MNQQHLDKDEAESSLNDVQRELQYQATDDVITDGEQEWEVYRKFDSKSTEMNGNKVQWYRIRDFEMSDKAWICSRLKEDLSKTC